VVCGREQDSRQAGVFGTPAGVEEADDADESEVHTHGAPEDDVPDEYLDKE